MKTQPKGYILVIVLILGLTLSTLFMLRLKILGSYVRQVDVQILETQAHYLAESAWKYTKAFPQNTAVYYLDGIALGTGTEGSLEAAPGEEGWDIYGRVKTSATKVEIHWFWDGKTLTDKTRKKKESSNY